MQKTNTYRSSFPFFCEYLNLIYLDSAATSQKPKIVIDGLYNHLKSVANPGRSSYGISLEKQEKIEENRSKIAKFFGTKSENLAFCAGVTDGMNTATQSLANNILKDGDEILLCLTDHKATILPWLDLAQKLKKSTKKFTLKIINWIHLLVL